VVTDSDANVFHKAIPFDQGILTLSGQAAKIKHWRRSGSTWASTEIWSKDWGGTFSRMRDLELADLDGDDRPEMVVATHDMGVVAIGRQSGDHWVFEELGRKPNTFVHEVETGDVDGDGVVEIYATPSERNRGDLSAQPGGVIQYTLHKEGVVSSVVAQWADTHAKEITVVKMKQGADRLYAVKEASLTAPVQVVQLEPSEAGWTERVVCSLTGEAQARFLLVGDPDGDGTDELVLAGKNTGLWLLEPKGNGEFSATIIDGTSGGFEHAAHMADMDGDGRIEIYVASERPGQKRQIRRYQWDGKRFQRRVLADLPNMGIVWHLSDGLF